MVEPAEGVADLLDTPGAGPAAIRGSAIRAIGYAVGLLLALGSAPLLFRYLGVDDFGRYTVVVSLITLAAGFSEGGLNALAVREWSTTTGEERRRLMGNLLGIRVALTAFAVAAAVVFAAAAGYGSALVLGTLLAGAGLIVQTVQTLLASPLQAELRFGWATAAELLRQVILVACLVALVLAGAGLVPVLAAQIPAAAAALVLTVALVRGSVPVRPRLEWPVWRSLLHDTLPYALAIAINIAYFRIAILYMSLAVSARATGYFSTSFRILEVVIVLPPVLLSAAFPILTRSAGDDPDRFAYATRRIVEAALIAGGLAVVGLELGARLAIDILAGPDYAPAVPILHIQAPAVLATFAAVALSYPLLSLRRNRDVLTLNGVALVVTLIGLVTLVAPHGIRGAAVATLLAEISLVIAAAVLFMRARPDVPLPFGTAVWVLVACGAGVAVAAIPGLPDVADVVVGCAIYLGVLLAARRVPRELLDAVRRR
jgi:O-antigen/teichoic acid export membrane protein